MSDNTFLKPILIHQGKFSLPPPDVLEQCRELYDKTKTNSVEEYNRIYFVKSDPIMRRKLEELRPYVFIPHNPAPHQAKCVTV